MVFKNLIGIFILIQIGQSKSNLQDDIAKKFKGIYNNSNTVLSRQRRYLVFPEGSSFQVVFDLTYPSVAIEGNVFVFGHTAAMAWELPSEPIFLDKKKMMMEESKENTTTTTTTTEPPPEYNPHADEAWKPWNDYQESPSWQTNWDRSSIDHYSNPFINYYQHNSNINQYRSAFARDLWAANVREKNPVSSVNRTVAHHIQRRSRRELYSKVEKLLSALSKDGKSCVLKAICQVSQLSSRKGTMWEEIVKAIFKSKHEIYPDEDHYDRASNKDHNCDKRYPECDGHVLSNLFKNKIVK